MYGSVLADQVILMGRFAFSALLPFQHTHMHKLANNKGAVGDTEEVAKQQAYLLYRGRSIGIPFRT